jgi:phosphopantothenoylcysteine decarboxylase/phosphopantothenate--cysteine ligase
MTDIRGKRILLGLSGGIAAYKAAELTRLLTLAGAEVRVVMTEAACRFITPVTMQALSGNPVHTDLWDASVPNNMAHIELSRGCDTIVVAPASADFLAKLALGLCDDLLSVLCLARECPLLLAPAMNVQMWGNPATQRNLKQLRDDGIAILGPASGDQACGEVGMGRMLEAEEILEEIEAGFQPKLLGGKRVLITAGPTFEPIDTVRGIANISSGKMGYAVARAARDAGAAVTLVSGPTALSAPRGLERIDVSSAQEMYDAVMARAAKMDVFIGVAAVADYRPKEARGHKLKKGTGEITLQLQPNPDILGAVAAKRNAPFCVGFAAETENLEAYAEAKRRRKKVPLIAANLAQHAFGAEDNQLVLLDDQGRHELPRAPKIVLARLLIAHIARLLPNK